MNKTREFKHSTENAEEADKKEKIPSHEEIRCSHPICYSGRWYWA